MKKLKGNINRSAGMHSSHHEVGRHHGHKRKPKHKKRRQTLTQQLNWHFTVASIVCMALVGMAASYLIGENNGRKKATAAGNLQPSDNVNVGQAISFDSADAASREALQQLIASIAADDGEQILQSLKPFEEQYQNAPWYLEAKIRGNILVNDLLQALAAGIKLTDNSQNAADYGALALIRHLGGDSDRAENTLQAGLELDPLNWELYLLQAEILIDEGQLTEGIASLQKARDLADQKWLYPILDTKLQLAQIEAGEVAFDYGSIASDGESQTSGEKLLLAGLAAALDNESGRAEELLLQARELLAPEFYRYYVDDHAFDLPRLDSTLAPLLTTED